ncbi:hypothetical protein GQ54DRAFT_182371 [Martensiomyces pterosporus]|nr:hypothetical protein GQ54DRAFT_182371 [Martensiomyces pterosporus]
MLRWTMAGCICSRPQICLPLVFFQAGSAFPARRATCTVPNVHNSRGTRLCELGLRKEPRFAASTPQQLSSAIFYLSTQHGEERVWRAKVYNMFSCRKQPSSGVNGMTMCSTRRRARETARSRRTRRTRSGDARG